MHYLYGTLNIHRLPLSTRFASCSELAGLIRPIVLLFVVLAREAGAFIGLEVARLYQETSGPSESENEGKGVLFRSDSVNVSILCKSECRIVVVAVPVPSWPRSQ